MSSDTPISETDAIFARAYANAIKLKFQVDVDDGSRILTSPLSQLGIAAGDLVLAQVTNHLIYKAADALQPIDNASYTGGSSGSYLEHLKRYITWIKTSGSPSRAVVVRMEKAREFFVFADGNYSQVLKQAEHQFLQIRELYPSMSFWQWIAAGNYPPFEAAQRTHQASQTELVNAMRDYFGSDATTLVTYLENTIKTQGRDRFPGYNADGLLDDQEMINRGLQYANSGSWSPNEEFDQVTVTVPQYNLPTYSSTIAALLTASQRASRNQVLAIDVTQGHSTTWKDYGFDAVRSGGVPFLSAEVNGERRTLNTHGRETDIALSLSMLGLQKFDVRSGQWDVWQSIKSSFPTLVPGAPEVLSSKLARIVSFLVGYDVELTVQFGSSMRDEVDEIYEEVKKTKGKMNVFGFSVSEKGGSVGSQVLAKFEDVLWNKSTGMMSLTSVKGQVYPSILAVIAKPL